MKDPELTRTQAVLDRTTAAIADRLQADFEDLTRDEATWSSVAKLCVMTIVGHLKELASEAEATLTPREFASLSQVLGTPEFAIHAGLPLDDARLALAVASTNLARAFVQRTILEIEGSELVVHNASGELKVQRRIG